MWKKRKKDDNSLQSPFWSMCYFTQFLNKQVSNRAPPTCLTWCPDFRREAFSERPNLRGSLPPLSPSSFPSQHLYTAAPHPVLFSLPALQFLSYFTVSLEYTGKGSPLGGPSSPVLPDPQSKGQLEESHGRNKACEDPVPCSLRRKRCTLHIPCPAHVRMNLSCPHAHTLPHAAAPVPPLLSWAAGDLRLLLCYIVTS